MEILSDASDVDTSFISDEDTDVHRKIEHENRQRKNSKEEIVCIITDILIVPLQAYIQIPVKKCGCIITDILIVPPQAYIQIPVKKCGSL